MKIEIRSRASTETRPEMSIENHKAQRVRLVEKVKSFNTASQMKELFVMTVSGISVESIEGDHAYQLKEIFDFCPNVRITGEHEFTFRDGTRISIERKNKELELHITEKK